MSPMFRLFVPMFFVLLTSCGTDTSVPTTDSLPDTLVKIDTPSVNIDSLHHAQLCNIVYDTITNPNYKFHRLIMDRYTIPEKRGYWMMSKGDTLDTYLYPQDIGVFFQELDSTEQGIYRTWTNKIVFMMLQHDSYHLGVVANFKFVNMDYFMWHVEHPMCNEISIDSTIACVKRDMTDDNRKVARQRILASLEIAKSK